MLRVSVVPGYSERYGASFSALGSPALDLDAFGVCIHMPTLAHAQELAGAAMRALAHFELETAPKIGEEALADPYTTISANLSARLLPYLQAHAAGSNATIPEAALDLIEHGIISILQTAAEKRSAPKGWSEIEAGEEIENPAL